MATQLQRTMKYENQQIDTIKRTQPVKRYSDSFTVDKLTQQRQTKKRNLNTNDSENDEIDTENSENEPENVIKYVPTRREVDSLVIDNYLFQRVSASTNKDGSIGWRCKEYRRGNKCQSTCRISANGDIIRRPGPHCHPPVTDAELVFMRAKADAKKRCRSENNISVQKIFLQEMGKAIINSGINLTPDDLTKLPKFEANKRCLQIQRKIGAASRMSVSSSDNGSITSSDDCSTKNNDFSAPVSPSVSVNSELNVKQDMNQMENKPKSKGGRKSKSGNQQVAKTEQANPPEPEIQQNIVQTTELKGKAKGGRKSKVVNQVSTEKPVDTSELEVNPSVQAKTESNDNLNEPSKQAEKILKLPVVSADSVKKEPPIKVKEPLNIELNPVKTQEAASKIQVNLTQQAPLKSFKKKGLNSIISGLWESRGQ